MPAARGHLRNGPLRTERSLSGRSELGLRLVYYAIRIWTPVFRLNSVEEISQKEFANLIDDPKL